MMKKAVITGITGQDGSYLSELLLDKGYEVHGIVRRASIFNRSRIEHLISDPEIYGERLFLHYSDLQDATTLRRILTRVEPDEMYHLAGQSHPGLSFEIAESTNEEVANATLRLLEILRDLKLPVRFYHASTSEIFGSIEEHPQTESTPRRPTSPYGAAKAYATSLCEIYRDAHDLFVCNGIAYNHESPRRGENFVTMKICREVARIHCGLSDSFALGNTDARRDWGYAPDYVRAMWLMLQEEEPGDYIMATGQLHSVQDIVDIAFSSVGMDPEGKVRQDRRFMRPVEPRLLVGNPSRAMKKLNWEPSRTFSEMIREMVESQVDFLKKNSQ
jgi:GDPmannose 4,6-dehydratase